MKNTFYIFVTEGMVSSLRKSIITASIGLLLKSKKIKINIIKIDEYLNINKNIKNPIQYKETFITSDGYETNLDLGDYERFTDIKMSDDNNFTLGQIYYDILKKEKNKNYSDSIIRIIPNITDNIKDRILKNNDKYEIVIVEIGSLIEEIESLIFIEVIKQMIFELGKKYILFIYITYIPYISYIKENKVDIIRYSLRNIFSLKIKPDIFIFKTNSFISNDEKLKISFFYKIDENCIFFLKNANSIYKIPNIFKNQGLDDYICNKFNFKYKKTNLNFLEKIYIKNNFKKINIGIITNYISKNSNYISIKEALKHSAYKNNVLIKINLINSNDLELLDTKILKNIDGILVPGGHGCNGMDGKILAIKYARENNIPYFGISLGMHLTVIELIRNIVGIKHVNSIEFVPGCKFPIISLIKNKNCNFSNKNNNNIKLGSHKCLLYKNSVSYNLYKKYIIEERYNSKYKINNYLFSKINIKGLRISGISIKDKSIEIIELKNHPWFIACQFHPEFTSNPLKSHPLFIGFIKSIILKK